MQLTKNFSLLEVIHSDAAMKLNLDNMPSFTVMQNVKFTAAGLERVRALLNQPIKINSWFRSIDVNKAVGGSKNSQHMLGQAVDFTCPDFGSPTLVALEIAKQAKIIGVDQLILESSWVHVSFTLNPRYEVLTLKAGKYLSGIIV